ncbi:MAG TPA: glycosyltransferase family 4 protein, partial [Polyangium sp.]|nr:glycosyltransferase family 4 protein [Polyangium sp.]
LDIIGDGSWMSEARSSCEKLGIADRVSFLGRKDHSELAAYYQNALCVIMPSRTPETFGLVGVEAMSHATAVIASDIGGIREWLVPEQTGLLVPPNDPTALRHALTRLLERPKLARTMGDAGRSRYLERFLPQHHIEKLISVFTEVMHSGSTQ